MVSGGNVLFGNDAARAAAGNVVDFVLWFNFVSGAFYIVAGAGIYFNRAWSLILTAVLAIAVSCVLLLFALHIILGGAFEMRTVAAMILRASFWIVTAVALRRATRQS